MQGHKEVVDQLDLGRRAEITQMHRQFGKGRNDRLDRLDRIGRTAEMHTPGVVPLDDGWTLSIPTHLRPVLAARHPGSDLG